MKIEFDSAEMTKIIGKGLEALGHMPDKEARDTEDLDYSLNLLYDGKLVKNYSLLSLALFVLPKTKPKEPKADHNYEPGDWIEKEGD